MASTPPHEISASAQGASPKRRSRPRSTRITHLNPLPVEERIMAENIGTADPRAASSGQGSTRAKFDEPGASTKSLADQALSAGQDLKEKAKGSSR
jgi:hypothetical protein